MRQAIKKKKRNASGFQKINGFTLSETLLALFASCLIVLLCATMMQSLVRGQKLSADSQRQLAILQIREIAASAVEGTAHNGKLLLNSGNETVTLEFHNNRLVKRPGYQILMEDVENACFEQEGGKINLVLTIHEETKTWQIL